MGIFSNIASAIFGTVKTVTAAVTGGAATAAPTAAKPLTKAEVDMEELGEEQDGDPLEHRRAILVGGGADGDLMAPGAAGLRAGRGGLATGRGHAPRDRRSPPDRRGSADAPHGFDRDGVS